MAIKTIYVKATKKSLEEGRVILWEKDPVHPGGEAFLSGASDKVCEVADTAAVRKKINEGWLEEVREEAPKAKK